MLKATIGSAELYVAPTPAKSILPSFPGIGWSTGNVAVPSTPCGLLAEQKDVKRICFDQDTKSWPMIESSRMRAQLGHPSSVECASLPITSASVSALIRAYIPLVAADRTVPWDGLGVLQFCRRTFFALGGYDETIYMGEDVGFYWRLRNFGRSQFRVIEQEQAQY